jgi:hypothetical protein
LYKLHIESIGNKTPIKIEILLRLLTDFYPFQAKKAVGSFEC